MPRRSALSGGAYAGTTCSENAGQGIRVDLHSSLRIYNSSITDNAGAGIQLVRDSGALVQSTTGPVTLSGNGTGVQCTDNESSLSGGGNLVGPDPVVCTGF